MNKYNFFRRFLPFLDEMFHAMMPMFQYEWAVPLVTSLLSGWGGTQTPGPTTQTQTMQYLPPQYTPQQQAINNLMYYGIVQNLMQPESPYADIINQMLYGTPATGTQAAAPGTAEGIIAEYQAQKAATAEEQAQAARLEKDLRVESLKPLYEAMQEYGKLGKEADTSTEERATISKNIMDAQAAARDQLMNLTGMSFKDASGLVNAVYAQAKSEITGEDPGRSIDIVYQGIGKELLGTTNFKDLYEKISQPIVETPITGEEVPVTGEEVPVTGEEAPATTGGLLAQMPTAEQIAKEFGLIRERGMEDISKWYQQAQRELEQRGISQYGGYMGTPFERDIGGILGKRGELEATLGSELGIAQSAAQTQNWYDMLQALGNLQALQSNIYSQRMTPWLGAAQQMTDVPYPYTTTTTTAGQPAGFLPAFVGGLYGGAGLVESISKWGRTPTSYPGLEV